MVRFILSQIQTKNSFSSAYAFNAGTASKSWEVGDSLSNIACFCCRKLNGDTSVKFAPARHVQTYRFYTHKNSRTGGLKVSSIVTMQR